MTEPLIIYRPDDYFRIEWHGRATFNVFLGSREVECFSSSELLEAPIGTQATDVDTARRIAEDWWWTEDEEGNSGKKRVQEILQNDW